MLSVLRALILNKGYFLYITDQIHCYIILSLTPISNRLRALLGLDLVYTLVGVYAVYVIVNPVYIGFIQVKEEVNERLERVVDEL